MPPRRALSGLVLIVLAAAGVVQGVRASVAQAIYHHVKFRSPDQALERSAAWCRCADRLYPYHYRLSNWMAQTAWARRTNEAGPLQPDRIDLAREFVSHTLALNPYQPDARLLQARLLALRSPAQARDYWRAYVDWHFWSSFNQAVLVELTAAAGDFDEALRLLDRIRNKPDYDYARRALELAWRREREMPPPTASGE